MAAAQDKPAPTPAASDREFAAEYADAGEMEVQAGHDAPESRPSLAAQHSEVATREFADDPEESEAPASPAAGAEEDDDEERASGAGDGEVADAAPDDEGDDEADDEAEGDASDAERQPRDRRSRKIRRLVLENESLQRRLQALESMEQTRTEAASVAPPGEKPTLRSFATSEEYQAAVEKWTEAKVRHEQAQARIEEAAKAPPTAGPPPLPDAWLDVMAEHDDFDRVVRNPSVAMTEDMVSVMFELGEDGARLAYYLGKHPTAAAKLARISDTKSLTFQMGRIAASLESGSDAAAEPGGAARTKARAPASPSSPAPRAPAAAANGTRNPPPTPIRPPAGAHPPAGAASSNPEKMSQDEYNRWRRRAEEARGEM